MEKARNIQLINTGEGVYSLSINNILIHSMYYPLKEAYNFAKYRENQLKNKNHIVIYGVGLGYHIYEMLKLISNDSVVELYDVDEEIIEIGLKYGLLEEILKDQRVKFVHGYTGDILTSFSKSIKNSDSFIVFKPEIKVMPKQFEDFKGVMDRFEIGITEFVRHGRMAKKNMELNNKVECEMIDDFYNKYDSHGKPIVIVASGPSLNLNLEKLKSIRDKVVIFAVGSSLKLLMNYGIKPDMITIIDPQEIVYNQFQGFENLDVPLCFLSTASNLAVTKYNGPKYKFYNSKENSKGTIIETGKSVATAALNIAIKGRAETIIFIGQDLAFINDKSHADNYANETITLGDEIAKKVEGIGGTTLKTTEGWLYFKKWIEDKIFENPQIKFINCSSGARIKGTIEKDLSFIIND